MSEATKKLLGSLANRIRGLDATRRRIDNLVNAGHISPRAAEQMYESLFLNGFAAFEMFLEDVFVAHLVETATKPKGLRKVRARVTVGSHTIGREIVIGPGKKYVDWLPFYRTIERAELFFRGGRPFTDVTKQQRTLVDNAQLIRNAIAHRSKHSQDQFEERVIGSTPIAPRERVPAAYLRGLAVAAPPVTRYETYTNGLLLVGKRVT